MADVGSSSYSETANNNNSSPPAGWPENMAPSGVNNSARENMAGLKRFWNRINGTVTGGGSANAHTASFSVAESAYHAGSRYMIKLGATNTAAASLNINALGAVTVKDASGAFDLKPGMLTSGQYAEFLHDGTNFRLLNSSDYLGPALIWKQSLSGANLDFDPLPTGFAKMTLDVYDAIQATDNVDINLLVKVSSFQTSSYIGSFGTFDDGAGTTASAQSTSAIKLATNAGNATDEHLRATATIFNADGTTLHKKIEYTSSFTNSGGNDQSRWGWGAYTGGAGAVTGLRLIPASGNWTSGTAVLTCWRFA